MLHGEQGAIDGDRLQEIEEPVKGLQEEVPRIADTPFALPSNLSRSLSPQTSKVSQRTQASNKEVVFAVRC